MILTVIDPVVADFDYFCKTIQLFYCHITVIHMI